MANLDKRRAKAVIVPITGFRESWDKPTGLEAFWWNELRMHSRPLVMVHPPFKWSRDMKEVARLLDRHLLDDGVIITICYSYGMGYGHRRLARDLGALGRKIHTTFSIDGVYRSRLWSTKWLAFTNWAKIRVPENVERVVPFVQKQDPLLQGHSIVAKDPKSTVVEEPVLIKATHTEIDDHPDVHLEISYRIRTIIEAANGSPAGRNGRP